MCMRVGLIDDASDEGKVTWNAKGTGSSSCEYFLKAQEVGNNSGAERRTW